VPPDALVGGNPGRVAAQHYDNSALVNFVLPLDAKPASQVSPVQSAG
jgi:hypothetical protein